MEVPIGLDQLCVFGMKPDAFVHLAASLDCRSVSLKADYDGRWNPYELPLWSMVEDRPLRRTVAHALADTGLTLELGEAVSIAPGRQMDFFVPQLDVFAELGARRLNLIGQATKDRSFDMAQIARLNELCEECGITVCIEFVANGWISSLAELDTALAEIGGQPVHVLIDPMHFFRFGQTIADLKGIDPARFAYFQMCDVPMRGPGGKYLDEAVHERLAPGDGELPLVDLLAELPDHMIISLELPQVTLARSGVSHKERLGAAIEQARHVIRQARAAREGQVPDRAARARL